MYLPPNKDNINERFNIIKPDGVTNYSIVIFNRWGEKLFRSENTSVSWDGFYKGRICPQSVYFYILDYYYLNQNKVSGTVTILE